MRPVLLTMQAFGPYAGREVVDFRPALDAGLFGIYGQTGSGKSMIFTAMTFALFGEAAKKEQDGASLRSDHAAADLPTEVSFLFDLGDRRYLIRRRPEQSRPKQRGEGETKVAPEAWLFDATGQGVEDILADRPGKVLAERKLGAVRDAVADLLGYGLDQFKRIVLLPQSQFEAFLTANTKDRLDILRDLFDVSLYRQLTERLKADAADAEKRVRTERELHAHRLKDAGFDTIEALTEGIASQAETVETLRAEESQRRIEEETARRLLDDAKATEALFVKAEQAETALRALQAQSPEIDALASRLQRAERAKGLLDPEDALRDADKDLAQAATTQARALEAQELAATKAARTRTQWDAEDARSGEREALRQEVADLIRHGETLDAARALSAAVDDAQARVQGSRADLEAAESKRAKSLTKQARYQKALTEARETESARQTLTHQCHLLDVESKAAETHERAQTDLRTADAEVARLRAAKQAGDTAVTAARTALAEAERARDQAQALHLASGLTPGAPCPVCGSPDHPAPATRGPDGEARALDLDSARQDLEHHLSEASDAAQALARAEATLDERRARLDGLASPARPLAEVRAALDRCRADLAALGPARDMAKGERMLQAETDTIAAAEEARDGARLALSRAEAEAEAARARHDQAISTVPAELRDHTVLEHRLDARAVALKEAEARRDRVTRALDAADKAVQAARQEADTATRLLADRQERRERARAVFTARLAEAGLDEATFGALKPALAHLDADRERVTAHRTALAVAEQRLTDARDALADKTRPDLPALQAEAEHAARTLTDATNRRAEATSALDQSTRLKTALEDSLRKLAEEEERSGPLRGLAALCDAKNERKLDLETFAIGAMFDQVLASANLRLGPMTGQRYVLEREQEGGARSRRGLGIQVFDIHTGKARPTATLSGGETFIAALALALGLADVVEGASGKVRLDTIFIDEGFGSLDTENGAGTLDQVLRVLNDLVGRNRAVGLISHVPLVREAIPNGFQVHKTLGGSRVEPRGFG